MRKLIILTSLAAIIATPGFAQTMPAHGQAGGEMAQHSAVMMADHTMKASKLIGLPVFNDQGETIGTVNDIVVKAGAVEPVVIISVGAFLGVGEKLISEPLSQVKLSPEDMMMIPSASKANLTARPAFDFRYSNLNR